MEGRGTRTMPHWIAGPFHFPDIDLIDEVAESVRFYWKIDRTLSGKGLFVNYLYYFRTVRMRNRAGDRLFFFFFITIQLLSMKHCRP